ncbi:hypothetical protein L1785_05970 [Antribacter sp. KLBMP9083]|uniref:Zinc-finger domain-containing protein n=1 Tax=Antribacter soli TaxID=2910976 RepID=A0AA41QC57_9MICO|nr:sigma factor-like helix-turn-helix DNA-binding protein [Antribacter soli]MCF4120518.1 hypothetical protein [Antribacter soli]
MTALSTDLSEWAAHRRAVVFTVSRRVPGVDPELAAARGLEALVRAIVARGAVDEPVAFWSDAAVRAALAMAGEATSRHARTAQAAVPALVGVVTSGSTRATADAATARPRSGVVPPVAEPVQRALDLERLHTAMEKLPTQEQQLLWDRHVNDTPVAQIAGQIGVLPYAARRRLRRAENQLASGFAEVHAAAAVDEVCRTTRASMHDYVRHHLMPRHRRRFEDHMLSCAGCTRAFVDVRESYWMLRAAAPILLLGTVLGGKAAALVAAGAGGAAVGAAAAHASTAGSAVAGLGQKIAVLVRSLLMDPLSLTAAVVGGLVATSAATGVAYQAGALPLLEPAVEVSAEPRAVAKTSAAPQVYAPADTSLSSPELAAPSVALPAGQAVVPEVGASLRADLGTGVVDAGAGVGLSLDDGAVEAQVNVTAGGTLLEAAYKIVPLSDEITITAVTVDEELAAITRLDDHFYVIPLTTALVPIDVSATVTVLSPQGASVDVEASVDLVPASQEEQGALTELLTSLLGSTGDGTSEWTGLLGPLGGLIGDTVDGLTGTLTGTTTTLAELAGTLRGQG